MLEWTEQYKYNSWNSYKGLTYYENYKQIMKWMDGDPYLPPPVEVNLDPNAGCNLNCYFCIVQRYLKHHREELGMTSLPLHYLHELVSFLGDWGVRGLCISGGGEPLLHPAVWTLPGFAANKNGMDVSIFTNGTVMTEDIAESLIECKWVAVSIDASNKDEYEKIKGLNLFNHVMKNMDMLLDYRDIFNKDVDVCYKFLVLPENQYSIYEACKRAKEMGFQNFHARPVDFERSDIEGSRKLDIDIEKVNEQFEKCHELDDENFQSYTVTHKFDHDFHVKHDFTRCLATPLVLPILTDGNAYLCVDRKMEEKFKVGSCYPNPESILEWWGSDAHRDLIKSVNVDKCSRCTWGIYNEQIEKTVIQDRMHLSFP